MMLYRNPHQRPLRISRQPQTPGGACSLTRRVIDTRWDAKFKWKVVAMDPADKGRPPLASAWAASQVCHISL